MKANESVAKVKIFDQTYSVRGNDGPEHIERLAQYVDGKMRRIAGGANIADTQKVAVLAALNIADDLYKLKQEYEELAQIVAEQNFRSRQKLDEVLKEPSAKRQNE